MNTVLAVAFLVAALVAVAFWSVFRKLVSRERVTNLTVEQVSEFTTAKYRRIACLLNEDEFQYLSSQPGYTEELGKQFRATRRRIFRSYLTSMRRDFSRLYLVAKLIAVRAPEDRPDLGALLIKYRFVFALAMLAVEYRLAIHVIGRRPIDVSGLVEALDAMKFQVHHYAVAAQPISS